MTEQSTYYFDLSGFLNRLTNEGFHIGVDTHILIQTIIAELPPNYELEELKRLLMPILCKSEKEQVIFQTVFRQFISIKSIIKNDTFSEESIIDNQEKKQTARKKNTNEIVLIILAIIAIIAVVLFFWGMIKYPYDSRILGVENPLGFIILMTICGIIMIWVLIKSVKNIKENNQKQVAKQTHGITPDDVHKIYADLIPVNLSDTFTQAVSRLRLRESLGIQHLDIKNTVKESINNLGFFTPKYKDYTKYTEYLVLIQADNPDDHNARLYNTFFEELEYRNISAKRYYFRTSPRFCYNEQEQDIKLTTVLHDNAHCVLLIFADLNTFISLKSNEPYKWVKDFTQLSQRYLLLPFGTAMEAVLAKPLRGVFDAVLPATEFGFEQLENYINQGENKDNFTRYIRLRQAVPTFPIRIETEEELGSLEKLLPNKIFLKWIAACAVYPDFSWKMTLFLGELLSDEKTTYNTWDNLRQLARLSWYKEAYMPQALRRIILDRTDKQTLQWLLPDDIEHIKKGIRQVFAINQQHGFVGNIENLLTELYREPNTETEKAAIKDKLGNSVDYVTATLVDSSLKDILFFDLGEFERKAETFPDVGDTSVLTEETIKQIQKKNATEQIAIFNDLENRLGEVETRINQLKINRSRIVEVKSLLNIVKGNQKIVEEIQNDIQFNLEKLQSINIETNTKLQLEYNFLSLLKRIDDLKDKEYGTKHFFKIPETVFIKGTSMFLMGSPKTEKNKGNDELQHPVKLSDFYMTKYQITTEQYLFFVNETNSNHPEWMEKGSDYNLETGTDNHYKGFTNDEQPIVGISWNNAVAYAQWLTEKTGEHYRLPTEAEWEFAARGGNKTKNYQYSGSNNLDEVAWYSSNSNSKTHPVGTKKPNELDIYDMSGNVWEWCQDWYGSDYYQECKKQGIVTNPTGAKSGSVRVVRGGSWYYFAGNCRSAYRSYYSPDYRRNRIGFRLVCRPAVS